jgi:hypothetical protein
LFSLKNIMMDSLPEDLEDVIRSYGVTHGHIWGDNLWEGLRKSTGTGHPFEARVGLEVRAHCHVLSLLLYLQLLFTNEVEQVEELGLQCGTV